MSIRALFVLALLVLAVPVARRLAPVGVVDLTPLSFLRVPYSAVAFRIRRALRFRRGMPAIANESKEGLFKYLAVKKRALAEKREQDLLRRFELSSLRSCSTQHIYRENLYYLDLLDRIVPHFRGHMLPDVVRAVDVGSQDFRYATALERWLRTQGRSVALTGIELDGFVIYKDLRSRADYAEAYARLTGNPEVHYRVEDFLRSKIQNIDVAFVFFPFVLRYALVKWGLPLSNFAPREFFEHVRRVLKPGGLLVVLNHTHEERDRQLEVLREVGGFEHVSTVDAHSDLASYADEVRERTMTLARRSLSL